MINIYPADAEDFSTLGLAVLQPTECTVEEKAGGLMELEMKHPVDDDLKWTYLQNGCIIKAPCAVREAPIVRILDNVPSGTTQTVTRAIYKVRTNTGARLRLRAKPSTSAKIIRAYKPGTEVVQLSKSGDWSRVVIKSGGATGWMYSQYLQFVRNETETVKGDSDQPSTVIESRQTRDQLFRIYSVGRDAETSMVEVKASHIFYDLSGVICTRDYQPENVAADTVLNTILASTSAEHGFTFHCTVSKTISGDYTGVSIVKALLDPDVGIVPQTGARIIRDNYDVYILPDEVMDRGMEIRHRKNLMGAVLTADVSGVVTRIRPVGKDKDGNRLLITENNGWVESDNKGLYPTSRDAEIEYDVSVSTAKDAQFKNNAAAWAELKRLAQQDFADGMDAVAVSLDVQLAALENSAEYADYAPLLTMFLYDTVNVIASYVGINAKLRVNGYVYDCLLKRYQDVYVGDISELEQTTYGYEIADGSVSGVKILPGSVNANSVMRNASIGYAKIAQAAVDQLSADAIVAIRAHISKLVAGSITTDQLYADLAQIAVAQITTANIKKANIDWAQIATLSAQIATIAQAQITTANIKNASIDWAQIAVIAAGSITADKLAAGSVTADKLAAGAVTAEKIASKTITSDLIAAKTITAESGVIDDAAIGGAQIADGSITAAKIVSLNADVINAGTLSAERLVLVGDDGVIYKINAASSGLSLSELSKDQYKNYINGTVIVAKSITAAQIAAQTITGNEILAGSITAKEIDVSDLFASQATINALNAMDIRGNRYLKLYVTDAVDDLSIGGRNYILESGEYAPLVGNGGSAQDFYIFEISDAFWENAGRVGSNVIFSFDWEWNTAISGAMNSLIGFRASPYYYGAFQFPANQKSGHFSVTIDIPTLDYTATHLFIRFNNVSPSYNLTIRRAKLEVGNKATDWSPAPEDAQNGIDALETRMTTAESQILQKADSITLSVLQEQVDGISVGGTNLYTGTQNFDGDAWTYKSYWTEDGSYNGCLVYRLTGQWLGLGQTTALEANTQYTLSAWLKQTDGGDVRYYDGADSSTARSDKSGSAVAVGTDWSRHHITFTVSTAGTYCPRFEQSTEGKSLWVAGLKLEKGNMPTDWSPAPEDAQSDITSLKSRVTTAESQILQKADSITLSTLQTTVNNISVGGTNLLLGTGQSVTTPAGNSGTNQTTICYYTTTNGRPQAKEPIVFSCDIQASSGATGTFGLQYTDTVNYGSVSPTLNIADYTTKKHIVYAITNPYISFGRLFVRRDNATGTLTISNAKLERGNKATDWSPAPEDPAGSLSVSSNYSKVDINTQRVRIVSKQMEVAVPADDGEDDVMRVDADGVHAEVVEADQVVSDSVVSTQGAIAYTPANGGALAAFLDDLSGKHLTGRVYIDCKNVTAGNYIVENLSGGGEVRLVNGKMNQFSISNCGLVPVLLYNVNLSNAGTAVLVDNSLTASFSTCAINAAVGIEVGTTWPAKAVLSSCNGDCTVMAEVKNQSELRIQGASKPTGTLSLTNGGEVYNATPDPTFAAKASPSIPTTQTVTVSLSPTNTYTLRGTSNSDGNKLYQGRYSSSQGMRKGVMLFTLPSDLTSASNIDSAVLTLRRISGAGQGGGVTVQVRCFDQTGTAYGSATAYGGQTVSIDVTSGVKAMKTNGYTGLMLYNPDTTLVSGKSYTKSYARFAGKGESGAPVLKISYRK